MVRPASGRTVALVSGSGGTGRTCAALNLAKHLAIHNQHTLLLDLCFGWGGLGISENDLPSYDELLEREEFEEVTAHSNQGFDILTCNPPDILDPSLDDLKKIAWMIAHLGYEYQTIIFDPPSGSNSLSLLSAGVSEKTYLFTRPEATSIASSYSLLKSLQSENLHQKANLVFSMVESAEQAVSLKTRFDLLTSEFLGFKVSDGGFIYRSDPKEGDDNFLFELNEKSENSIKNLKLDGVATFQNATAVQSNNTLFRDSQYQRR
jgi:flagellar biosynthesis protein FlhG